MNLTSHLLSVRKLKKRAHMQGDSGENVDILGGESIGHCEKKNSYQRVSNSE
jgi:hypothetical protein